MTDTSIAERTAGAVTSMGSHFMLDGATYEVGAAAGFIGMDFYAAGRAGVLGDVSADIVTAALVFFHPDVVRNAWEASRPVMPRDAAAALFASCLVDWAAAHLDGDIDWDRLTELAGRITGSASIAGAPMFAGWRVLPVPDDPTAAALHQLNLLRELRMSRHGAAVMAVALDPGEAVRQASSMAAIFGWEGEARPETAALLAEAEALTNRATAGDYAVLTDAEGEELVALCDAAKAAVH